MNNTETVLRSNWQASSWYALMNGSGVQSIIHSNSSYYQNCSAAGNDVIARHLILLRGN